MSHDSSSTTSGAAVQDQAGGSQPAGEVDYWAGMHESLSEGRHEVAQEWNSSHSKKSWKSESDGKRPNMGKDVIPVHDGSLSMREYQRRVRLFQATTSIDPEYQAGRLVEKMQSAWAAGLKHWICGLFVAEITPPPLVRRAFGIPEGDEYPF